MKTGRILGVILSLTFVILLFKQYNIYNDPQKVNNSFELISYSEDIALDNIVGDNDIQEYVEKLTYKNTENEPVVLNSANVEAICTGFGKNKKSDETLVSENLEISAFFQMSNSDITYDLLYLKEGEEATIYIDALYVGDEFPNNDVSCKYNVQIARQ